MENFIFCLDGKLTQSKAQFAFELRQQGAADIKKTATRTTTHLVVPDGAPNESSKKVQKARELGIEIVNESWCRSRFTATPVAQAPRMPVGPSVMLAKNYKTQNVHEWWVSEKLDGVRAIWDGQQFWSRSGNRIHAPAEFCAEFPKDIVLDGELFGGRGNFSQTSGLARRLDAEYEAWQGLEYHVFDAPFVEGPFEKRQQILSTIIKGQRHLYLCEQTRLNSEELPSRLDAVTSAGGEGLMLRKPGSKYECKRTSVLLKVKPMHDAECVVIGYETGTGKYRDMCGALMCQFRGKMFKVGSGLTDADRRSPPKIGSRITFGYFEITAGGVPRHPTFKRVFEGRI